MKTPWIILAAGLCWMASTPALAESPAVGAYDGHIVPAVSAFTPPKVLNPARLYQLAQRDNPAARLYAADSVRRVRRSQTVRAAQVLIQDPDVVVRRVLVESVSTAPSRFWYPLLQQALGDEDAQVRTGAVRGLARYPVEEFIAATVALLSDASSDVRRAVREEFLGAGELGLDVLADIELGVRPAPEQTILEVDEALRHHAGSYGADLAQRFNLDGVDGLSAQRVAGLLAACGRPGVHVLLAEMERGLTQRAFIARRALVENPREAVVPVNERLLSMDLEHTKSARITVYLDILMAAGDIRGLPGLERLITSARPYLRAEAARVMGHHDHPESVSLLLKALDDPNRDVRGEAAKSLGSLGVEQAVKPLIRLVARSGPESTRAIQALGAIGDPRAVLVLERKLKSGSPVVRRHACEALEQIGHPSATRALEAIKRGDPDAMVRYTAARALARIE